MVGVLWNVAFVENTSPGEYMKAVSRMVKLLNWMRPRTDSAKMFLEDLVSSGIVTIDWSEYGKQNEARVVEQD